MSFIVARVLIFLSVSVLLFGDKRCPDGNICSEEMQCCAISSKRFGCCDMWEAILPELEEPARQHNVGMPSEFAQNMSTIGCWRHTCRGTCCQKDWCCRHRQAECCGAVHQCCKVGYKCCGRNSWCCPWNQMCSDAHGYCITQAHCLMPSLLIVAISTATVLMKATV